MSNRTDTIKCECRINYGKKGNENTIVKCKLCLSSPRLIEALAYVQYALAQDRDEEKIIHPNFGEICLEEVKYIVVDEALSFVQKEV